LTVLALGIKAAELI